MQFNYDVSNLILKVIGLFYLFEISHILNKFDKLSLFLVFGLFFILSNIQWKFRFKFHLKFVIKIFWETLRYDHSKLLQYIFKENFSVHSQFQFESIQSNKLGWIIIHYLGFCSFYWIKVTIFNIYKYHNQMPTMATKIHLCNSFKFRKKTANRALW